RRLRLRWFSNALVSRSRLQRLTRVGRCLAGHVKKALLYPHPVTPLSVPHLRKAGVTESSQITHDSIALGYATYLLCPLWVISRHWRIDQTALPPERKCSAPAWMSAKCHERTS